MNSSLTKKDENANERSEMIVREETKGNGNVIGRGMTGTGIATEVVGIAIGTEIVIEIEIEGKTWVT